MANLPGYSLARRLAAGETVYTGWCALPAPIVAETIAREGFVAVTIDQLFAEVQTLLGQPVVARHQPS